MDREDTLVLVAGNILLLKLVGWFPALVFCVSYLVFDRIVPVGWNKKQVVGYG